MAEDKYRVQRKPITSSEISGDPAEQDFQDENPASSAEANKAMLERIAQIQGHEQHEMSESYEQPDNPSFHIKGMENAPPMFKEALKKTSPQMQMQTRQPVQSLSNSASNMKSTGSSKLEELLQGLYSSDRQIFEEITLPSLGKFYNGNDGPTNGKLHIRKMTGEEETILATPRFVRKGEAINMIFERCIQERIDPDELLTEDRTYILIYLRGISYSPNYDVELRCPETDQTFATTIDLNDLYVDNCPSDFDESSLEDVLPHSGYKFKYRLSTGRDETAVNAHKERMQKNFDRSEKADDTLLYRTALLLEHIEGLEDKTELLILLRKLPIADVAYIRGLINDPPFGVDTQISVISPYTSQEFTVDLPLEANFFFPRLRKEKERTAQA